MKGVLCFGASITFGRGDNKEGGWTGRLKKYFESKDYYNVLYNLGISGNSTDDLLKRMEVECSARIVKKRPGDEFIILIGIGTNDSRFVNTKDNPQTTPEDFNKNILKVIEIARNYTNKIIFIGLTPVDESKTNPYETTYFLNDRIKKYDEIIKKCCEEEGIFLIDLFEDFLKEDYLNLLGEGLHPNSKGHDFMFGKIKDFLEDNKLVG